MVSTLLVLFVIADFILVEAMLGNMLRFERGWAMARVIALMVMEVTMFAVLSGTNTGLLVTVNVGDNLVIYGAVISSYIKAWSTAAIMLEQGQPAPTNYKTMILISGILLLISFFFDILGIFAVTSYVIYGWLLMRMRQANAPLVITRMFWSIVGQIAAGILFGILIAALQFGATTGGGNGDIAAANFFFLMYLLASKLFTITSMGYTIWDICCAPPKETLNVDPEGNNFYELGDGDDPRPSIAPPQTSGGAAGQSKTTKGEETRRSN